MNTWNVLPPPYRRRVHQNTLATVKKRILDADTTVANAPISTKAAQVDEQLLARFLTTDAPLEEPKIGSRMEPGDMPVDIDEYEEMVSFDHAEDNDSLLALEDVDNVQPRGRRRRGDRDSVSVDEHLSVESANPPRGDINNSAEVSARDGWAADSYQCGQDPNGEYPSDEGNDDD